MNKFRYNISTWLIALLLIVGITGCEDRMGITTPPIISSPTVTSIDPANLATLVPMNQRIATTFSKMMDASTITSSTFYLLKGTTPIPGYVSYNGLIAVFAPLELMEANTEYTVKILTGAKDSDGNSLANNFISTFTTGAKIMVVPPVVSSIDPLNGSVSVPLNQKIAATFSKAMDASTITASTFTLKQGNTSIAAFVSYSGTTAILAPSANLAANTVYTVTITTGAKDLTGNPLVSDYVWNFTTGAAIVNTPPLVSSTYPESGATDLALNEKISATFTKSMNPLSVTTATFTLMQGTTFVSGTVSYVGTTATYSPSSNLSANTTYTATITTGVVDLTGNALASNYVWSFTTGSSVVITPPVVVLTDPLNQATGVPLNQKVAATFSKTMDATTITAATFLLKQGSNSISGFVSYSGKTAIFTPATALLANTLYTARITTGAKTLSGTSLAADYVWTFTTGGTVVITAPVVTLVDPLNNANGVALNKKINATFSKTMDASTINTATFSLMQGSTLITGSVSLLGNIATFSPSSNLLPNTMYTATITTGAKDLTGTSMVSNYVWSFTTISTYTVSLSALPIAGGTTTGNGTFSSGSLVTVNATANSGYTFTNWTENSVIVSTSASYVFTITGNRTLVARFDVAGPIIVLGQAGSFGGFGGNAGMTNQGLFTIVNGDIGTTAASTLITGFHDGGGNVFTETPLDKGTVTGTIFCAPPAPGTADKFTIAQKAFQDATTAFNFLKGLPGGPDPGAGELGGLVLAPGTYTSASGTFKITSNNLTLDAQNNPNAIWVFQMAQTLTVGLAGQARSIILINGAQAKNVYWQVGSAATINGAGGGTMVGTIISYAGVTFSTPGVAAITTLNGRALSLNASVTLVNTVITIPSLAKRK